MPELCIKAIQAEARAALSEYFEEISGARELSRQEVLSYDKREFSYGWEIAVRLASETRLLRIMVDDNFPLTIPRIAVVDRSEFLRWPHVERDGLLCLHSKNVAWNIFTPVDVVKELIRSGIELVENSICGENRLDFIDEFLSYWGFAASEGAKSAQSLLSLDQQKDREIAIWRRPELEVIADSPEQITEWLLHRYGQRYASSAEKGALIWISKMPIPQEYPSKASQVLRLFDGVPNVLRRLVREDLERLTIVLASKGLNGVAIAGLTVSRPQKKNIYGKSRNPITPGFRRGHVRKGVFLSRFFGADTPVIRFEITRADHNWVHGRDHDSDQETLKRTRVFIVGCGSLGGPVAISLAQAGFGVIKLVDPDWTRWSNISRHPLGADDIGRMKVDALAVSLQKRFPHISIESDARSIQEVLRGTAESLDGAVVINATGDWAALVSLEMLNRAGDLKFSVIHTWLERHALAGHAVFSPQKGPCVLCRFNTTGDPLDPITEWPKNIHYQEPECGGSFSPYGAADVLYTVALVTDLAIDIACGRVNSAEQRMWVGPLTKLQRIGGNWSSYWMQHKEFRNIGGMTVIEPWIQRSTTCTHG